MRALLQKFAEVSAIGYGLGMAPKAPGTFGSIGGLVCGWAVFQLSVLISGGERISFYIAVTTLLLLLSFFAWWSIARAEAAWGTHDEGRIVIDEFAGQAIAVAFFQPSILVYVAGFILFRVFDIWKPGPIGTADEKLGGALGTLVDDLIAGAVAALIVAIMLLSFPSS